MTKQSDARRIGSPLLRLAIGFGSLLVGSVVAAITNNGLLGLLVIVGSFLGLLAHQFIRAVRRADP